MGRTANRVHTEPAEIARIEGLIAELPNGAHVALDLDDGRHVSGIVAARPIPQLFFDADGTEGTNAVVRLEDPALNQPEQAGWQDVWVDSIVGLRRIDPEWSRARPQH